MSEGALPIPPVTDVPGPWWMQNFIHLRENPEHFLSLVVGASGLLRVQLEHRRVFLCLHPAAIRHVLIEQAGKYSKQTPAFHKLRMLLGEGLLTNEGMPWRRQRRIAQPEFTHEKLEAYEAVMQEEVALLLQRWKPFVDTNQPLDVAYEMMRLALRIVCKTLLGSDIGEKLEEIHVAMTELLKQAAERALDPNEPPLSHPTPRNKKFLEAMKMLDGIISQLIERQHSGVGDRNNLLFHLLHARDPETGEAMSDRQLRDEVMTMFMAGHETTANAMTWMWHLLAQHPGVRDKLESRLDDGIYPNLVIKEALRLYPPVYAFGRMCVEPTEICGQPVQPGDFMFIIPFVTQRHPRFWKEPAQFQPERFAIEKLEHPWAYLPFGAGQRHCIGKHFAQREMLISLTRITGQLRLDLAPGQTIQPQGFITMRPRNGLLMLARSR